MDDRDIPQPSENIIKQFAHRSDISYPDAKALLDTDESPEKNVVPYFEIDVEGKPSAETTELVHDISSFVHTTSVQFKKQIGHLVDTYQKDKGTSVFTEEMAQKMKEDTRSLPRFRLLNGNKAHQFIKDNEIGVEGQRIDNNSVLLIFNLPPILSRFWYKGGTESWGERGKDVGKNEVEWGHFYREVMPVIWNAVGYEETEGTLDFSRINYAGDHEPKNYYYVWQVKKYPYH